MFHSTNGALAVLLGIGTLGLVLSLSQRTRAVVADYFRADAGPFNLAVLRIVFFGTLPFMLPGPGETQTYIELGDELMTPPHLMGWAAGNFPLDETLMRFSYVAIVVLCVMAAAGLYTRFAMVALLPVLAYYLTIPQLFGKVNHYHHVLWFGCILAASRCADALSIDAARRAWKRDGEQPPERSRAYALPLRLIWLLLGLLYFFPGLYKIYYDKLDWFSGQALEHIMWSAWYDLGWEPMIRVDTIPGFLVLGAVATIVFECGFIFALFSARVRPFLPFAALGFHNSTNLMMKIPFWSLQAVHFSLIDWDWAARRVTRRPLVFAYDGTCGICRKTVGALKSLTVPGGTRYVVAQEHDPGNEALLAELHVLDGERDYTGFYAYRRLARRVPFTWPLLPFLYLPGVPALGRRVYERVSFARLCQAEESTAAAARPLPVRSQPATRVVAAIGTVLAVAVLSAGLWGEDHAWPVATYPTFAGPTSSVRTLVMYEAITADGRTERGRLTNAVGLPHERAAGLERDIIKTSDPAEKSRTVRELASRLDGNYRRITVREVEVSVDPDNSGSVVGTGRLIARISSGS